MHGAAGPHIVRTFEDGGMDHESVGSYRDENAQAWAELARAGFDHYRDGLNTPAFLAMLPEVDGKVGLDLGCDEGRNTRLLAARMTGIDISPAFVRYASEAEEPNPLGIRYEVASAVELPFGGASFDFVTAFMSRMDIPGTKRVLARPSGCYARAAFCSSLFLIPVSRPLTARPCATRAGTRTRARWGTTFASWAAR